ncbi:sugar transferase [Roseovarius nubinhibens]|uniref:Sugar transferase n=1 Tax=Roseovarius nubinhibens TaxID=314263 RepID=A0A348WA07_9RHOB|nr:sugar transferase [Roseovarius nubinhibens]|tara:strand:- start:3511 stop:4116 length:606 start_codon:yes stop_codon:yes gene_type:complete
MVLSKRIFDLVAAISLSGLLLPVMAVVAIAILLIDGRPVFYVSERMKGPNTGFRLWKFRTMKPDASDSGPSGGNKQWRVTRTGAFLRRTRLDELPQLWNVLRGDISFVGPRPPLRMYVERFPEIYNQVLKSRPGITGLASVYYHAHEEMMLAHCKNAAETDAMYSKNCVPRKARFDLIYQRNQSICFDIEIMLKTVFKKLR